MRSKAFETVALTTIAGGLAWYLRPEMSQVWDVILEAPRDVWVIATTYGLTYQPTIWHDILFNNGTWWLAGLAMFWLVALVTVRVVRMVYTVGREWLARRAAVEFPDWLPGDR
jgi:hypothetical protein